MHAGFTEAQVALADHERPGWWRDPLVAPTEAERRFRVRQLGVAGRLLAAGRMPEPNWVQAQLLDLRDVLADREWRN